jgi:hypothetical protein
MATQPNLTEFEKEIHQRLCEHMCVPFDHTTPKDQAALNRLVTKGYATYDGEKYCWRPQNG